MGKTEEVVSKNCSAWQLTKFTTAVCNFWTKNKTQQQNNKKLFLLKYKPVFVNIWIAPVKSIFTFSVEYENEARSHFISRLSTQVREAIKICKFLQTILITANWMKRLKYVVI